MTKKEYINKHPESYLASALINNDWADDQIVYIVGGLNTPNDKRSNLYQGSTSYVRGGHRQHGTEGWWYAVKDQKEAKCKR